MKKILLVVALFAIFAVQGNAQKIHFGAKGGINFANLTGDDAGDADTKLGFHVGVVAEYMFNEQFAFQPELLFSTQGAKGESEEDEFNVKAKLNLNYINLPLIFKYYVAPGFSIQAGPQLGFLLSAKQKFEGDFREMGIEDDSHNVRKYHKKFDFGMNFGLGYKFNNNIFIDGRYNIGLSNIADFNGEDDGDYDDDDDSINFKNSVFQISVGYMF